MPQPTLEELLKAGVHFGHQTRRWNPKMRRFIFAERNGIHIIDLQKTLKQIELAQKLVREVVLRGENVLFVCTKRQLAQIVSAEAEKSGAMHVTERWLGGLLTNFQTVKKQTRRLKELEAGSEAGGDFENYTKKEQLLLTRQRDKLSKNLSGIKNMARVPGLIFIVDSKKERIAVSEANKLGVLDRIVTALPAVDVVIVDNRATGGSKILAYFEDVGLPDLQTQHDCDLVFTVIATDDKDANSQIAELIDSYGTKVRWLVARNLRDGGNLELFSQSNARTRLLDYGAVEVDVPCLTEVTKNRLQQANLTVGRGRTSDSLHLLDRSRCIKFHERMKQGFNQARDLLLP